MPRIIPWRRRSNGTAASRRPRPWPRRRTRGSRRPSSRAGWSDVTSSAATTTTRSAAAGADPVLGQGDRLGRAGAGRVDLGVRPTRPDQLGELRVTHRQDAEQEAAVERVAVLLEGELQVVDAPVDLGQRGARRRRSAATLARTAVQRGELLAAGGVDPEAGQLVGEVVVAGERRGEDRPRCCRAGRREASTGRAAGCRRSSSGSGGRAGCRRRAGRRCRRRWRVGSPARARGSGRRRRRTRRRGRTRRPGRPA